MQEKYKKLFFLIFFIIIFIVSIYFNIYLTKSKSLPSPMIFDLNGVYFDFSLIDDNSKAEQVKEYIDSKNIAYYSNIVLQKDNPIGQFYSYCGYLKSNQKKSIKYLENLLLTPTKVDIYLNEHEKKINYPLGFAILTLIKDFPQELAGLPVNSFYTDIESTLLRVYNSNFTKNNSEYKKELLTLISDKNPKLFKEIFKDEFVLKPINEMTINDKIESSVILNSLNPSERNELIINFLGEENERILFNTLNSITEEDTEEVAELILKLFYTKKSSEITKLLVEKYSLILKEKALPQIKNFMSVITDYTVVKTCLEQIKTYGDNSYYDFLKTYLLQRFPDDINLLALDAIVETTYETKPDDVLNTMIFLLRKGKEILATYAIQFHIKQRLNTNSNIILSRLKLRESENMEKLAIEYIDTFSLRSGGFLLQELTNSNNEEIQRKANDLLKKLKIQNSPLVDTTNDIFE
jgi:hypothetical protein